MKASIPKPLVKTWVNTSTSKASHPRYLLWSLWWSFVSHPELRNYLLDGTDVGKVSHRGMVPVTIFFFPSRTFKINCCGFIAWS